MFQISSQARQFAESPGHQRLVGSDGPTTVLDSIDFSREILGFAGFITEDGGFTSLQTQMNERRRWRNQYTSASILYQPNVSSYASHDYFDALGNPVVVGQPNGHATPGGFYGNTGQIFNQYPELWRTIPPISLTAKYYEGLGESANRDLADEFTEADRRELLKAAIEFTLDEPFPLITQDQVGDIDPVTGLPQGWGYNSAKSRDEYGGVSTGYFNVDLNFWNFQFTGNVVSGSRAASNILFNSQTLLTGGTLWSGWLQTNNPNQYYNIRRSRPRTATSKPYWIGKAGVFRGRAPYNQYGPPIIGTTQVISSGVTTFYTPVEIPFPVDMPFDDEALELRLPVDLTRVGSEIGYGWICFMILDETPAQWSARTGFVIV